MTEQKHPLISPDSETALAAVNVHDLIASIKYYVDETFAHIQIKDQAVCAQCEKKPCLDFCPAQVFSLDGQGRVIVGYQACLECGSCRIGCCFQNIDWRLPHGGYGVAYKFG